MSNVDQRPRCDCCGEFLGPEHVATKLLLMNLEVWWELVEYRAGELEKLVSVVAAQAEKFRMLEITTRGFRGDLRGDRNNKG